ncbi:interleukin-10 isoform X1 [Corvus moneduloides]|uniref:interleukin-10 isoform X1 n=1 Tax=Corvus moneduloides TaxID=1196302 RepID=UPI001362B1FC|nr:interleukin-10 isoform X1 [Corvus moneduloides]
MRMVQEHHVQPALHVRARLKRQREGRRRSDPYLDAGAPKITPAAAMSPSVQSAGTNPVPDTGTQGWERPEGPGLGHSGSFHQSRCKAAGIAAPVAPQGKGKVGSSSDKGQEEGTATTTPLGRNPWAEAAARVPLQHRFFTCEDRSRSMKHIKETFTKMNKNGIYKAMGEFDIFINYIEKYLMMKRRN